MHVRVSAECKQATPPNVGATLSRLRLCEPVPHEAVQVDQASKVPTLQSTAQGAVLQSRVSAECGHATPPLTGAMSGTRLRDCEPVPHVLVHAL